MFRGRARHETNGCPIAQTEGAWPGLSVGALELPKQYVAALDRRIHRLASRLPAGQRLFDFILDDVADKDEGPEPQAFGILGRQLLRDLLDGYRCAGIAFVKTLRTRQVIGGGGNRQVARRLVPCRLNPWLRQEGE